MKKLLSLILVLSGMVSTANADDTWKLKGSFDSWGDGQTFVDGQASLTLNAGDVIEFKVVKNNETWYGGSGTGKYMDWTITNISDFNKDDARNCIIFAAADGIYTFTLTESDGNPTNLSVAYPTEWEKSTVYLCNTLSWSTPYFYLRRNSYYDGTNGSGSNQCPNGMAMTQIGETNIYKAEYPTVFFTENIAFLDKKQDSYDNFYEASVSVRGDFNTSNPIFIPKTTSNESKNGCTYYNEGAWHAYPTYTRDVTEDKFGTLCLPFAATVTGATVYEITSKVMDGETLKGINLTSVDGTLTAGKPYIFKATGTTLTATYTGSYSDTTPSGGMVGNLSSESINVPTDNYVVKDNKLCKVVDGGSGVTVSQYKAYITLAEIAPAAARGLNFMGFDDESTGIQSVETAAESNDNYYNLAGQRVAQPAKGLFVKNGKKVILK